EELGIFAILDEVEAQRKRAGVPDELLLRTASDVAVCGAGLAQWSSRGAVPRASSALATGLGPGADPLREQWTASASRGTARGILAVSSGYVARYLAAGRRVSVAASASRRSAVALPAAVGARQSLCRRWQR